MIENVKVVEKISGDVPDCPDRMPTEFVNVWDCPAGVLNGAPTAPPPETVFKSNLAAMCSNSVFLDVESVTN